MTDETRQSPAETVSHDRPYVFRAGDIVHHELTGEDWVVAYVDGEYLAWAGWPAGEAKASDCRLKTSCSDDDHIKFLGVLAKSEGKRATMARRALEQLANCQRPEGER